MKRCIEFWAFFFHLPLRRVIHGFLMVLASLTNYLTERLTLRSCLIAVPRVMEEGVHF